MSPGFPACPVLPAPQPHEAGSPHLGSARLPEPHTGFAPSSEAHSFSSSRFSAGDLPEEPARPEDAALARTAPLRAPAQRRGGPAPAPAPASGGHGGTAPPTSTPSTCVPPPPASRPRPQHRPRPWGTVRRAEGHWPPGLLAAVSRGTIKDYFVTRCPLQSLDTPSFPLPLCGS